MGTMIGHRSRFAMKHLLYKKMMNMQAGNCPSDLSEGTILGLLGQTGHGHGIV
jgi:hypothetical protein